MKAFSFALALALLVAGCDGAADDADGTDTTGNAHDTMGMPMGGSTGGDTMGHGGTAMSMPEQMPQMHSMMLRMLEPADTTYDRRFIDLMSHHHQGAIMMSEDALTKAVHPELKGFAQKVIDEQRKEIDQMKKWRQSWYGDSAVSMMSGEGMPMSMEEMDRRMMEHLGAADSNYDDRYIDMMIPHHQGAVMMAGDAAQKATHPELKSLAQKMVSDQNKEIEQLEAWRKEWYAH